MTPEDRLRHQQLERQQAQQDIADIEFLSKNEPFNRYWVRRLNDYFHACVLTSRTGGTAEVRETARIESNLLEKLTQMPARDRAASLKIAETEAPRPQEPRQVT